MGKFWKKLKIYSYRKVFSEFYVIKQADYLLLYEQNWLKEGTEALVLKKTAESSKWKPIPNWQIWLAHSYSAILHKQFACFIKVVHKLSLL